MRRWILTVTLFLLGSLQAGTFDRAAELQILDCIQSREFSNTTIYYPFNGHQYPVLIIHNPQHEYLWGNNFSTPTTTSLLMIADLPLDLLRHLEDLIMDLYLDPDDYYIDLRGHTAFNTIAPLHPVYIADRINDPVLEPFIREVFSSTTFVNQVFYYYLDNNYYKVRLLHNPEGYTYKATKRFRLEPHFPVKDYTISWSYRYGIAVNQPAPQELLDYISNLVNSSYWDWYFNFEVFNGTYVGYSVHDIGVFADTTTTYSLDTWFNYTENLRLAE